MSDIRTLSEAHNMLAAAIENNDAELAEEVNSTVREWMMPDHEKSSLLALSCAIAESLGGC